VFNGLIKEYKNGFPTIFEYLFLLNFSPLNTRLKHCLLCFHLRSFTLCLASIGFFSYWTVWNEKKKRKMLVGIFLGVIIRHAWLFFIRSLLKRHTNKKGRKEQKKTPKMHWWVQNRVKIYKYGGREGYTCIYKVLNLNFRKNHFGLHSVPVNYYRRAHTLLILSFSLPQLTSSHILPFLSPSVFCSLSFSRVRHQLLGNEIKIVHSVSNRFPSHVRET
jgi:hypothetical protein